MAMDRLVEVQVRVDGPKEQCYEQGAIAGAKVGEMYRHRLLTNAFDLA